MDNKVPDLPLGVSAAAALAGMEVQRRRIRKAAAELLGELRESKRGWLKYMPEAQLLRAIYAGRADGINIAIAGIRAFCKKNL